MPLAGFFSRAACSRAVAGAFVVATAFWMPHVPAGCAAVGAAPAGSPERDYITSQELAAAAQRLGVDLRENTNGPWYQMELYSGGRQLGKTSGWAQPFGVLHLETIEVRRFTGYWSAKPQNIRAGASPQTSEEEKAGERKRYADIAKVARWFGLILSVSIGCWNMERSPFFCQEAHLLAIRDEEKQHKRLVRYYKSLGFKTIRENEDLTLQDQIVWGGEGTLMKVDSDEFMSQWTPVVRELAGIVPTRQSIPAA